MTTINHKAVRRKTNGAYPVLFAGKPRQIVVAIAPGDTVTFRELGRRQTWTLPIERMFRLAVRESRIKP